MDKVGLGCRTFGEERKEPGDEVRRVRPGGTAVAQRGCEDYPGMVLTCGRPAADDAIEVLGVLGDKRSIISGGGSQKLLVGQRRKDGVVGRGGDVMAGGSEVLGGEAGVVNVEQWPHPARRSRRRCHSRSSSEAASALLAISASISSVNSA